VHHGRVVKRTGDGSIIEFRSVVDAVRCAIEVQNAMVERNAGVPPERRIEFRVGIHLGDVVEEGDGDLMGDGVNIAARLGGIATPGAICLSEDAYRQVKARLDLSVSDLGQTQLKNIAEPIRVFLLQVGSPPQAQPATQPEPAKKSSPTLSLLDKPSIAVLPFQNMTHLACRTSAPNPVVDSAVSAGEICRPAENCLPSFARSFSPTLQSSYLTGQSEDDGRSSGMRLASSTGTFTRSRCWRFKSGTQRQRRYPTNGGASHRI
jgi:hypothetical protein